MQLIKQSEATAARRRIYFTAVSSTNLQTRLTGLTSGSFTVRISEAGGADAAGGGSVTEQDATDMPGIYYYECAAADLDTLGPLVLRITNTGMEPREIVAQVVAFDPNAALATSSEVAEVAGLLHKNSVVDNTTYTNGVLTGFRVRVFSSAAAANAATDGQADDAAGEILRFTGTATAEAESQFGLHRLVRAL